MELYRNIGVSNIRRPNGEVVEPQEVFTPTEKEEVQMESAMWVGIRVQRLDESEVQAFLDAQANGTDVDDDTDAVVGTGGTATAVSTAPKTEPKQEQWTLKISPEDYLKRHPTGPQADFARRLVSAASVTMTE